MLSIGRIGGCYINMFFIVSSVTVISVIDEVGKRILIMDYIDTNVGMLLDELPWVVF